MSSFAEILDMFGSFNGIGGMLALIFLALGVVIITASGVKKWGLKALGIAVAALILFSFISVMNMDRLMSQDIVIDPDPGSFTIEARELLISIADAQILYFAKHNQWAGYQNDDRVFKALGWRPERSTHYAYYCGNDYLIPGTSLFEFKYPEPASNWPYGIYPEIALSDFTCMAIANNDRDAFPDVWMINKFKKPVHLFDDATDKTLVDIVSKPLDMKHFYAKLINKKSKKSPDRVYVEINLPAFRLTLYEDGRFLKSYPIAVGMRGFKTPVRDFYMERMEWNPWWIPPRAAWCMKTIVDEETGKERKEGCKPVGPGAWNPLGPVKMVLQSSFLIHGTNKPKQIGTRASHGCIRMYSKDAIDLGWKIMVLAGTKQPLAAWEQYKTRSRTTFRVGLLTRIQVSTVYRRLEVFDKFMLLHPDVYKWQPLTKEIIKEKMVEYGLKMSDSAEIRMNPKETVRYPINF